jgi:hypothetical protein
MATLRHTVSITLYSLVYDLQRNLGGAVYTDMNGNLITELRFAII